MAVHSAHHDGLDLVEPDVDLEVADGAQRPAEAHEQVAQLGGVEKAVVVEVEHGHEDAQLLGQLVRARDDERRDDVHEFNDGDHERGNGGSGTKGDIIEKHSTDELLVILAHEMGHGIHQSLAADQGYLMSDTPLTLAETASVFAEMLTFRHLLDSQDDAKARRYLLAGKVEDMLNTVVRQVAFHNFETEFHDQRRAGELTADEIADIWMETQRAALGPAIKIGDDYRPIWSYVPHFVHTPFYVYAYAFGDCLVNALWQQYQVCVQQGDAAGFIAQYTHLLMAGGTERYDVALERFDLDASQAAFWSLGLDMVSDMIDELESLT